MKDLAASIVAYKNPADISAHALSSFPSAAQHSKFLIPDNLPIDELRCLTGDPTVSYISNGNTPGFDDQKRSDLTACVGVFCN